MRPLSPLVVFLLLVGCRSGTPITDLRIEPGPPAASGADLGGTTWALREIALADGAVLTDAGARLQFDPDGGRVSVRSCNQCGGSYAADGDTLRVAQLACTRMACPGDRLELERYVEGVHRYTRTDAALTVYLADEAVATFVPAPGD